MKKYALAMALAVTLLATAPAVSVFAQSETGCTASGGVPKGCGSVSVPEPGSLILLSAGILAVGGLAVLGRKKFART